MQSQPPSPFQLKAKGRGTLEAHAPGMVYRPTSTAIRLEGELRTNRRSVHAPDVSAARGWKGVGGLPPPSPPCKNDILIENWLAGEWNKKEVSFFFDQIGQFIMCHGPLWAKFRAEYGFRQCQGVHTGCSSRLRPHGFLLRW